MDRSADKQADGKCCTAAAAAAAAPTPAPPPLLLPWAISAAAGLSVCTGSFVIYLSINDAECAASVCYDTYGCFFVWFFV